jgi:hypothetical protein
VKFNEHRALVTNVQDPLQLGRIKVTCASLLDEEVELPFWIPPRFHFVGMAKDSNGKTVGAGWFGIPAKDSWVELLVPEDSAWDEVPGEQSLQMEGGGLHWKCTAYNDVATLPAIFKTNYPQRSGYVWPNGWVLFTDSKTGEMDLGYASDGKTLEHFIQIKKNGRINIKGTNVHIGGDGAGESMALGDALYTFLNTVATGWGATHTHQSTGLIAPTGGGPVTGVTGTPVSPMDVPVQADLVSGKHKVEK